MTNLIPGDPTPKPRKAADEIRHLAYIDTLRGIAFLALLAVHTVCLIGYFPGAWLFKQGGNGVPLFFLVSAVTLCLSAEERQHRESSPWLYFYIRRFFRIAPLYWLAMLFYWTVPGVIGDAGRQGILAWMYPRETTPHAWQFVSSFFFVNGWNPHIFDGVVPGGWSISVEMTFYLIFPLLFIFLNSLRRSLLAVLVFLAASRGITFVEDLVYHHLYSDLDPTLYDFSRERWFPNSLGYFCVGICTYHVLKSNLVATLYQSRFMTICGFLFGVFFLLRFVSLGQSNDPLLVAILMAMLIVFITSPHLPWVVNPVLGYIGKISFSCYLLHFFMVRSALYLLHFDLDPDPVNGVATQGPWHNLLYFFLIYALSCALTVLVSTFTYRFIEKPGIATGRWIIRRLEQSSRMPAVAADVA